MMQETSLGQRFLALLLCAVLVLSMLPGNIASAENNISETDEVVNENIPETETPSEDVNSGELGGETEETEPSVPEVPEVLPVSYGTVISLNGGSVTGSGTAQVEIRIEDVQLNRLPADEAAGRMEDGWWIGFTVTAPADFSGNATYQVKGQTDEDYGPIMYFVKYMNGANAITFWIPVTHETLEEPLTNLTASYIFDWNADAEYEQTVDFTLVPSDKIVLNKAEQTGFVFESEAPQDQWVGQTYVNPASGGNGTGNITYKVLSGEDVATVDANTGVVTFLKPGTVTIQATKAADEVYKEASVQYTVTAVKNDPSDFVFQTTGPVTITYAPGKTYTNTASSQQGTGKVTYAIVDGEGIATIDPATGEVTVLRAGAVTVQATKAADAFYNEVTAQYVLTVEKADQAALQFDAAIPQIIYAPGKTFTNPISGGSGNGNITYEIIATFPEDAQVATINPTTGELTILRSGVVTVKATKAADDCYNSTEATYELHIEKASQTGFGFATPDSVTVTYNDNGNVLTNAASGGQSTGEITYAIIAGNDIATIDPATGEVTVLRAGTVTVQATKATDDCYNATSTQYVLTVEKANQSFLFADGTAISKYYGITAYANPVKFQGLYSQTSKLTYAIVGANTIGASIDAATGKLTFQDSGGKVGKITVTATKDGDDCYNPFTGTYTLSVSYLPTPDVAYTPSGDTLNDSGWYTSDVTFAAPDGYEISYSNALGGNEWTPSVPFSTEGVHSFNVYLRDSNGSITDAIPIENLKLDKTNPSDLVISYTTNSVAEILNQIFGFANKTVNVYVSAKDSTSGIAKLEYSLDGKTFYTITDNKFTVPTQRRNQLTLRATDVSGRTTTIAETKDGKNVILVVDDNKPLISTDYIVDPNSKYQTIDGILYTNDPNFALKLTVTESNFDLRAADPTVLVNGIAQELKWTVGTDGINTAILPLNKQGDYTIQVDFNDRLQNAETYTRTIHVDYTLPTIEVNYLNTEVKNTVEDRTYYGKTQELEILVTEHNFRAEDVVVTTTATDIYGNTVPVADFAAQAKTDSNWTHKGDLHILTLTFDIDANYTFDVTCQDLAMQDDVSDVARVFTVDTEAPNGLNVTYSQNALDKILENISFGFYQADRIITMTAFDATAGMDYFTVTALAHGSTGATTLELPKDLVINSKGELVRGEAGFIEAVTVKNENGIMEITFQVPAQFHGEFLFEATDLSANISDPYNDTQVIVVDTIAPGREVLYTPNRVVAMETMEDVTEFAEGDQVVLYYNQDAVVTFRVTEANFYPDQVIITLDGAVVQPTDWVMTEQDVWQSTFTITEEGDHVIGMTGVDYSGNIMPAYTSQRIVIDKTAPEITVVYNTYDPVHTLTDRDGNERDYFSEVRTATITIKEHNFRPADVKITVNALDVTGKSVQTMLTLDPETLIPIDYAAFGQDAANWSAFAEGTWRREDDTYQLTLVYESDANYTFDIEYTDLATTSAADYTPDYFTVDRTAPKNPQISYSKPVLQEIVSGITFGYYNAPVTVTISAEDDTSGIFYFVYSYSTHAGVSSVNAGKSNLKVTQNIVSNGNRFTANVKVPQSQLTPNTQFNGEVQFTAYDRVEQRVNKSLDIKHRIVVDNIAPTSTIAYNAPVQTVNGISYYAGNIQATVTINEANFFSDKVVIEVTKDGQTHPVDVAWTDNSVDIHVGTFTLTGDGDYIVSVRYTDKSGNAMADYTSNQLTLDTTAPVIEVSNVGMNTANKKDPYGFVITVRDTNLDAASLKPVLNAVLRTEEGLFKTQPLDLGAAQTVTEGQVYTFTVENLTEDALYSLRCSAQDMAHNPIDLITLEDSKTYQTVQFSINREGSTYGFGNDFTEKLINDYFVYSVEEDLVLLETNVDPIEDYTVTLNGRELTEGTDYTSEQSSEPGQWSIRKYTVKKSLFTAEGEYNLIISSTDKAGSDAYSDVKGLTVAFVVDQTKPVVTISGMETGGRYQTSLQTVTLMPTDEGGRLKSLKVILLNSKGEPQTDDADNDISLRFEMSGEELLEHLAANNGLITFTIPTGLDHQVQIICDDMAVNAQGQTNVYDETFQRVTVSENQLVIFYANKPAFYGTVGGSAAGIGLLSFLLAYRKRKKKA